MSASYATNVICGDADVELRSFLSAKNQRTYKPVFQQTCPANCNWCLREPHFVIVLLQLVYCKNQIILKPYMIFAMTRIEEYA